MEQLKETNPTKIMTAKILKVVDDYYKETGSPINDMHFTWVTLTDTPPDLPNYFVTVRVTMEANGFL